jgi:hypothetical protein
MKMLSMVDLFGQKPIWKLPSLFSIISDSLSFNKIAYIL